MAPLTVFLSFALVAAEAATQLPKRPPRDAAAFKLNNAFAVDNAANSPRDEESMPHPPFAQTMLKNTSATEKKLNARDLLSMRQSCDTGYQYCDGSTGGCCPAGWDCCSIDTCSPVDGECCSTGEYCEADNMCVLYDGEQRCCTDRECTAYVDSGVTYHTTNTPTRPVMTTEVAEMTRTAITAAAISTESEWQHYYWIITWYYTSYYYTFRSTSTIPHTIVTDTTTLSVSASNSADASSMLSAISETLSLPTPAAATSLASAYTSLFTETGPTASGGSYSESFNFTFSNKATSGSSWTTSSVTPGSGQATTAFASKGAVARRIAGGLTATGVMGLALCVLIPGILIWL